MTGNHASAKQKLFIKAVDYYNYMTLPPILMQWLFDHVFMVTELRLLKYDSSISSH